MFIRTSSNELVNADRLALISLIESKEVHHKEGYWYIAGYAKMSKFTDEEPTIILERFNYAVDEHHIFLVYDWLVSRLNEGNGVADLGDIASAVKEASEVRYNRATGELTVYCKEGAHDED